MARNQSVLIIGAGLAGLSAARRLAAANIPALVIDKGRGVGGRMATRRSGEATFDHGAQFFSAKTPVFQDFVRNIKTGGAVKEWWPVIPDTLHARWVGIPGMSAVPKLMAQHLTIITGKRVVQIEALDGSWQVRTDDGATLTGSALLLTIPAPQALELLENSPVNLPANSLKPLQHIAYHPCLALLATLSGPSGIPAPGGLQTNDKVISWLADNFQKGVSKIPAVTIHASPAFSQTHLDGDLNAAGRIMLEATAQYLQPATVLDWQVHRWRYSLAYQRYPLPFFQAATAAPLLFGGDGFGMGNVEGAYLSGMAMAERLLEVFG